LSLEFEEIINNNPGCLFEALEQDRVTPVFKEIIDSLRTKPDSRQFNRNVDLRAKNRGLTMYEAALEEFHESINLAYGIDIIVSKVSSHTKKSPDNYDTTINPRGSK